MRNNFVQDKEYDSEAEDVEEGDQLSFSGLDMGPCPFAIIRLKGIELFGQSGSLAKWLLPTPEAI